MIISTSNLVGAGGVVPFLAKAFYMQMMKFLMGMSVLMFDVAEIRVIGIDTIVVLVVVYGCVVSVMVDMVLVKV